MGAKHVDHVGAKHVDHVGAKHVDHVGGNADHPSSVYLYLDILSIK